MLGLWLLGAVAGGLMNPAGAGHDIAAEARCLVKADVGKARVFAASVPNSEVEQQALAALAIDLRACGIADLPADVRLVLGGAIAELEIKRYWRAMPIMSRRNIVRLNPQQMDAAGVSERTLQRAQSWPAAVAIVFCARTRDPKSADAILRAKPGSSREADEVRRMTPALERCVEKGQVAPLNIATIRAVLARSEYSNGFGSNQPGDSDASLR